MKWKKIKSTLVLRSSSSMFNYLLKEFPWLFPDSNSRFRLKFPDFSRFSMIFSKTTYFRSFLDSVRTLWEITKFQEQLSQFQYNQKNGDLSERLFPQNYFGTAKKSTQSFSKSKESKQTNFLGISKRGNCNCCTVSVCLYYFAWNSHCKCLT